MATRTYYFLLLLLLPLFFCQQQHRGSAAAARPSRTGFSLKLFNGDIRHSVPENDSISSNNNDGLYLPRMMNDPTLRLIRTSTHSGFMFWVEVEIGVPPKKQKLMVDTMRELTWTQCYPLGGSGFQLDPPHYAPAESTRYEPVSGSDPLCERGAGYEPIGNHHQYCKYNLYTNYQFYRTKTRGTLAKDTFRFPSSSSWGQLSRKVAFGCSSDNDEGMFHGYTDMAGVFGLSNGKRSFLDQFSDITLGRFSFCPPIPGAYSHLRFGNEAGQPRNGFHTISIPRRDRSAQPQTQLAGVSVARKRIDFEVSWEHNCVIDTGSRNTVLSPWVYQAVQTEVTAYLDRLGVKRLHSHVETPDGVYPLCFRVPHGFSEYPSMAFHFHGGAELRLLVPHLFAVVQGGNVACLGMIPGDRQLTSIGVMQQVNTRFIVDYRAGRFSFGPEECSSWD